MRASTLLIAGPLCSLLLFPRAPLLAQSCESALGSQPALEGLDLRWSADGRTANLHGAAAVHAFGDCDYAAVLLGPLSIGDVRIDSLLVVVARTAGTPSGSVYPAAAQSRRAAVLATRSSVSFALSEGVNVFGVLGAGSSTVGSEILSAVLGSGLIAVSGTADAGIMRELAGTTSGGSGAEGGRLSLTLTGSSHTVSATFDPEGDDSGAMLSIDSNLALSDVPGLGALPHAGDVTLTGLSVSRDAARGRGLVGGDSVDLGVFKAGGEWVLAAEVKGLGLSTALGAGDVALLAGVQVTDGVLIRTGAALSSEVSAIPEPVRPMFASAPGNKVELQEGVGVIVAVEASATGALGRDLATLGLQDDRMVFVGSAPGAVGGSGGFDVRAPLSGVAQTMLSDVPAFVHLPSDLSPALFVKSGSGGAELGIEIDVDNLPVVLGQDTIEFDAVVAITAGASGASIGVTGSLDGTWQKPFGIGGLTLDSATMSFDVQPTTSSVSLTLGGSAAVGAEHVALEASVTATGGVADAAAFEGTIDRLTLKDVADLANDAILAADPRAAAIQTTSLPDLELRSVNLAFASPGSQASSVGLNGAGTRLKADVYVSGKDVGNFDVDVDDAGFRASGAAQGLNALGSLAIDDPRLDISAGKGQSPQVSLSGKVTILDVTDSIAASIGPDSIYFSLESEFGAAWKTTLAISAKGDPDNATVSVSGEFDAAGLTTWLSSGIGGGIPDVTGALVTTVADSLVSAVHDAAAALDTVRAAAQAALHKALQELSAADSALSSAQSSLSSCEGEVSYYRHKRDDTSWTDPGKKAYYEGKMLEWEGTCGARRAVVATAQASVNAIEKGSDVFVSVDMQPTVVAQRVLLGTAKGILAADSFAVNVSKKVGSSLDSLLRDVSGQITVNRAGFSNASLSAITGKQPVELELDVTVRDMRFVGSVDFTLGGAAHAVLDSIPAKLAHGMAYTLRTEFEDTTATPGARHGVAVVDFEPRGHRLRSVSDQTTQHVCLGSRTLNPGASVLPGICGSSDFPHQTWDIIQTNHGGSAYRTGMICASGGAVSGPCMQYDLGGSSTTRVTLHPSDGSSAAQQWNIVHDGNTFFFAPAANWNPDDFGNSRCLMFNKGGWEIGFWPPCQHASNQTWYVEPSSGG